MPPPSDEQREAVRRFGYAVRSKPAEPPGDKHPGALITGSHSRSYLPHIKSAGGTYFVTFRLADSLPRDVVVRLKAKARAMEAARKTMDENAVLAAQRESFCAFERELDSGRGACWLRRPEIAVIVADALAHFGGARYRLSAWVIMPNHVHAVVTPLPGITLSSVLHSWKSFTAKEANKLLPEKTAAEFWQRESFDHLCRDPEEEERCVSYVERNPVTVKLCARIEDWPWSSANIRAKRNATALRAGKPEACDTAGGDACATS